MKLKDEGWPVSRRPGTRFPWWRVMCGKCGGPLSFWSCDACSKVDSPPQFPCKLIELDLGNEHVTGRLQHSVGVDYHTDTAANSKAWRERNPEKVRAYLATRPRPLDRTAESARYREKHRERINAKKRQARARAKREAANHHLTAGN